MSERENNPKCGIFHHQTKNNMRQRLCCNETSSMVEVLTGFGDNTEIYFRLLIIEIIWKGIYFLVIGGF